jgi:hypothetical protein
MCAIALQMQNRVSYLKSGKLFSTREALELTFPCASFARPERLYDARQLGKQKQRWNETKRGFCPSSNKDALFFHAPRMHWKCVRKKRRFFIIHSLIRARSCAGTARSSPCVQHARFHFLLRLCCACLVLSLLPLPRTARTVHA